MVVYLQPSDDHVEALPSLDLNIIHGTIGLFPWLGSL